MPEPQYVTEHELRERIIQTLRNKIEEEDRMAEKAAKEGTDFKRKHSLEMLREPFYKDWADTVIGMNRQAGLLVTDQQKEDLSAERPLKLGDQVKYLGPNRLEPTSKSKDYLRANGERGSVSKAILRADGLWFIEVLPHVAPEAMTAEGPDVFIAACQMVEKTPEYFNWERLP